MNDIEVHEDGTALRFSFDEMLRYSGPGSPGGVALGFKVLERAFGLLAPGEPVERREVVVHTAFGGPGARDACELVTRALTDGRYLVDEEFARPERGDTLRAFVFRVAYRHRTVTLLLRPGFVTDEFVRLARLEAPTSEEQERLTAMKQELADSLLAADGADIFDIE